MITIASRLLILSSFCFCLSVFAQTAPSLETVVPANALANGYAPGATYNMNINTTGSNSNKRSYYLTIENVNQGDVGTVEPVGSVVDTQSIGDKLIVFTTDTGSSPAWNFKYIAPASSNQTIRFTLQTNYENVGGTTNWRWNCIYELTASSFSLASPCTNSMESGIESVLHNPNIDIFPNPAVNSLNINYEVSDVKETIIQLYDLSGKLVIPVVEGESLPGIHQLKVDVSGLAKGFYAVKMAIGDEIFYDKISVQ